METFVTRYRRFLTRLLISLIAGVLPLILFRNLEVLQGFDLRVRSFLLYERGPQAPHRDVFLVTADDQTVAQMGWPLPRQHYAEMIRTLNQYGARVIAFDLLFENLREKSMDDSLAAASQNFNNVIHAFRVKMYGDGYDDPVPGLTLDSLAAQYAIHPQNEAAIKFFHADTAFFPHPRFARVFKQAGLLSLVIDDADRFQKLPLVFKYAGNTFPSLGLLAWCKYLGVSPDNVRFGKNFWGYHLRVSTPEMIYEIPIDQRGQATLNFYGPFEAFPNYSIWQIHQAAQDLKAGRAPQVHLAGFKDKVVFIGGAQTGGDTFVTPYSAVFPGMGIFATAVSNFLNGETLRELPWYVDAGLVLILTLLLNVGMAWAGKNFKARETVYACLFFAALVFLFNAGAYEILFKGLNAVPAIPATNSALLAAFCGALFYEKSWREKLLKQQVGHLENDMQNTRAEIVRLNDKISVRDEEFKTIEYFITEIENHFDRASAEMTRRLQPPLERMKLIKEKVYEELEELHAAKQRLQDENKNLVAQIAALQTGEAEPIAPGSVAAPAVSSWKKIEEAARVMEHYRAFEQKAAVKHHYDTKFGMVTPVMNGRLNGEIGKAKMLEILEQIPQLGAYDSTVLITGETGTGKERVAHAIHQHSRRKDGPFEIINIAALPETLIEDELFGHARNAFTGAQADRVGAFERADGGTIFLDEIGDLKFDSQVRLLRVLQEKTFYRVGGNTPIKVDVRIIAATNKNLEQLIEEKKFRDDLYFRLNVARLHLPPLRERKEEIPHLVHYFLARLNDDNKRQKRLVDDAMNALILHEWPGNIRELQNFVESAYIKCPGDAIRLSDLAEKVQQSYREVFDNEFTNMWESLVAAAKQKMESLFSKCQSLMLAGGVEEALQAGQLRIDGVAYEDCYNYMKAYLDDAGSSFQPDQRETLAKQTMVALSEHLAEWCRSQKMNSMEFCWKEIENLLGRTRKQINNWKHEVGLPPFAATT